MKSRRFVVAIMSDDYEQEIRLACYLIHTVPLWIELTEHDLATMVEKAKSAGADVAIVRGSMWNHKGDKLIELLEQSGIKTMCVTLGAWSHTTAPYPIARTECRRDAVFAMCEFIRLKGEVGDRFREPQSRDHDITD